MTTPPPNNNPDRELSSPHDMVLPKTHWQNLKIRTLLVRLSWKKLLISLLIFLLLLLFLPFPYYYPYQTLCQPCLSKSDIYTCPPCPQPGWRLSEPLYRLIPKYIDELTTVQEEETEAYETPSFVTPADEEYIITSGSRIGWKRFIHNTLSFTFEYPENYFADVDDEGDTGGRPEDIVLLIHISPAGQGQLGSLLTIFASKSSLTQEAFTDAHSSWIPYLITDNKGYKQKFSLTPEGTDGLYGYSFEIFKNGYIYNLEMSGNDPIFIEKTEVVFDQILSTFKFLD